MNQDNLPRSSWYASPAPAAAQKAPPPRKKKHTALKVRAITVCVLLLLVASVYAFSDSFGLHWSVRRGGEEKDYDFSFRLPGGEEPPAEKPKETPAELP